MGKKPAAKVQVYNTTPGDVSVTLLGGGAPAVLGASTATTFIVDESPSLQVKVESKGCQPAIVQQAASAGRVVRSAVVVVELQGASLKGRADVTCAGPTP
jgi:hypothetical protein